MTPMLSRDEVERRLEEDMPDTPEREALETALALYAENERLKAENWVLNNLVNGSQWR